MKLNKLLILIFTFTSFLIADSNKLQFSIYSKLLSIESSQNINFNNFVMSEKLDGVRAIFDRKTIKTRSGRKICPPQFWLKEFENLNEIKLDGELWIARGKFGEISSAVAKFSGDKCDNNNKSDIWQEISYNIFDSDICENKSIKNCEKILKEKFKNFKYIKIIEQKEAKNKENIDKFFNEIIKKGGEGIILRENLPKDFNNRIAYKYKPFYDAECIVKEHIKGKGKNSGKLGSILCEMNIKDLPQFRDSIESQIINFKIGTGFNETQRKNPPKIGEKIQFRYNELTKNNIPRFAVFIRIRNED